MPHQGGLEGKGGQNKGWSKNVNCERDTLGSPIPSFYSSSFFNLPSETTILASHFKDRSGLVSPFASARAKASALDLPPVSSSSQDDPSITLPLSSLTSYKSNLLLSHNTPLMSTSAPNLSPRAVQASTSSSSLSKIPMLSSQKPQTTMSPNSSRRKQVKNYEISPSKESTPPSVKISAKGAQAISSVRPSDPSSSSSKSKILKPSNMMNAASSSSSSPNRQSKLAGLATPSVGDTTRDSVYSSSSDLPIDGRLSGVVTTASAISLQRVAAHTRVIGQLATASPSSRIANVEKNIGVTTRSRKSREVTNRGSSRVSLTASSRNSASMSQAERASKDFLATNSKASDTFSKTASSSHTPTTMASIPLSVDTSKAGRLAEQSSFDQSLPSTSSTRPPQSASISAHRFLSPITPTLSLEKEQGSTETNIQSSIIENLNPYSDTWGQNSSVAQEDSSDPSTSMDTYLSLQRPRNASVTSATSSIANRSVISSLTTAREVDGSGKYNFALAPTHHMKAFSMSSSATSYKQTPVATHGALINDKQVLLEQLLASLALIDSRPYQSLQSIEEVETCKKELVRVEKRINDVKHKLKVDMRVREAADKLRRTGLRRNQHRATASNVSNMSTFPSSASNHAQMTSSASGAAAVGGGPVDVNQAEIDVANATRRTDATTKELVELKEKAMTLQRTLLQHQTRVLALRVKTLEEEQAVHLQAMEEEENGKVSAHLAIEEVEQIRDKLKRVEKSLENEKRDREEEVNRWRRKQDEDKVYWQKRQEEEQQKWVLQLEEAKRQGDVLVEELQKENAKAMLEEKNRRHAVEVQLAEQRIVASKAKELEKEYQQMDFEMTAERKIMMERQQLFIAFEKRLDRAETRLREQDDRCAQMLGKVDGREEMDSILDQIKAGYGAVKKEKTAGQDIDGLIDSIATHIGDMEDEMKRTGRSKDDFSNSAALEHQLEAAERELQAWKNEAESAKRSLSTMQRQSISSRMSAQVRPRTFLNATATSEVEARLALVEKKNLALEAELAETRLYRSHQDPSTSPPIKVAGIQEYRGDAREVELFSNLIQGLLCTMPVLDPMFVDLRKLQKDLGEGTTSSLNSTQLAAGDDDIEERCREIMERSRVLITICTRLVDRTISCETRQEAFENELVVMEEKCDELRTAMEDLRRGNATHLNRERKLQSTVNELHKSLTAKSIAETQIERVSRSTSPCSGQSVNNGVTKQVQDSKMVVASMVATRRSRGIPNPLTISRSNSNLSFTPMSSRGGQQHLTFSSVPFVPRNIQAAVAVTPTTTTSNTSITVPGKNPPRSMTLGMGTEQLRLRVRQLESELIQEKMKAPVPNSPPAHTLEFQESLLQELEEHKRELEYVKGVESKQRIDLL